MATTQTRNPIAALGKFQTYTKTVLDMGGIRNSSGDQAQIGETVVTWNDTDGNVYTQLPGTEAVVMQDGATGIVFVRITKGGFYFQWPGQNNPIGGTNYCYSLIGRTPSKGTAVPFFMTQRSTVPTHPTITRGLNFRANWNGGGYMGVDSYVFEGAANGTVYGDTKTHQLGAQNHWHVMTLAVYDPGGGYVYNSHIPYEVRTSGSGYGVMQPDQDQMVIGARIYDPGGGTYENGGTVDINHIGLWKIATDSEAAEIAELLQNSTPTKCLQTYGDSRTNTLEFVGSYEAGNVYGNNWSRNVAAGEDVQDMAGRITADIAAGLEFDSALMWIGTNNFTTGTDAQGTMDALIAAVLEGFENNLWRHLFLMNDTPRNTVSADSKNALSDYSHMIESYFGPHGEVTVVDSWRQVQKEGYTNRLVLDDTMTTDGTHLTLEGYRRSVERLMSVLVNEYNGDTQSTPVTLGTNALISRSLEIQYNLLPLQKLSASGATGTVNSVDNGNGTYTLTFFDTDGTTPLSTATYTTADGNRVRTS